MVRAQPDSSCTTEIQNLINLHLTGDSEEANTVLTDTHMPLHLTRSLAVTPWDAEQRGNHGSPESEDIRVQRPAWALHFCHGHKFSPRFPGLLSFLRRSSRLSLLSPSLRPAVPFNVCWHEITFVGTLKEDPSPTIYQKLIMHTTGLTLLSSVAAASLTTLDVEMGTRSWEQCYSLVSLVGALSFPSFLSSISLRQWV